ncbi:hypothetical protein C8R44DRAFT_854189 [Mycena epipterygia]|nr:hypothetical protein C8R44DRAFT_854189 [Mycena epipterygia]
MPFLHTLSTLCLSILDAVQSVKSNKDECFWLVEHIHEILCAIIHLWTTAETDGQLPPTLLYDIAKFTETLQKIYSFLNTLQGMGKIKQFFKQADTSTQLKECSVALNHSLNVFRIQVNVAATAGIEKMNKNAEELHDELLELLVEHPELTISDRTSSSLLLPPFPQIFHGRESEYKDLVNMIKLDGARIAILGTGGIGKTSLATAVLHHPDIAVKYSLCYFISCHSTPNCAELVSGISTQIGYGTMRKQKDIIHFFTYSRSSLLVLDNFETPWESASSRAEITMRGAERPGKVKWSRPFLPPLEPLANSAALQKFIDIAEDNHSESGVHQLLELTGNIPLAVTLIANVVAFEGCSNTLSRWNVEGTHLLSDGFDKRSSLDISIMLSISSSRMSDNAQELLSILSMLPDGFSDADLVQSGLPIVDILSAKATLLRTSLTFVGNDRRLKLLVPIREYVYSSHPPANTLKVPVRMHFHQMLELWDNFEKMQLSQTVVAQIVSNLGNLQTLLSDSLSADPGALNSVVYLHNFIMATNRPVSPLMFSLVENITSWQTNPAYGRLLGSVIHSSSRFPKLDTELLISNGNKYFQNANALDQANWYRLVGGHYRVHSNNIPKTLEYRYLALSLADNIGHPTLLAWNILCQIAEDLVMVDDPTHALMYAQRAYAYAKHLGYRMGEAGALTKQARCYLALSDFQTATTHLQNAIELFSAEVQRTALHLKALDLLGEVHLLKTEYLESRALRQESIATHVQVRPGQPQTLSGIFADLNIAEIDIETDTNLDLVEKTLDTALTHLTEMFVAPIGLLFHDMTAAQLKLHGRDLGASSKKAEKNVDLDYIVLMYEFSYQLSPLIEANLKYDKPKCEEITPTPAFPYSVSMDATNVPGRLALFDQISMDRTPISALCKVHWVLKTARGDPVFELAFAEFMLTLPWSSDFSPASSAQKHPTYCYTVPSELRGHKYQWHEGSEQFRAVPQREHIFNAGDPLWAARARTSVLRNSDIWVTVREN